MRLSITIRWLGIVCLLTLSDGLQGTEASTNPVVRQVTSDAFTTINGRRFFNRPLYGSTNPGFVTLGDRPHISLMWTDFKNCVRCGDLLMAVGNGQKAKWIHDFDHIEARYEPGLMYYTLRDPILDGATLKLDVAPLDEGDGYIVRLRTDKPVGLLCAFGGFIPDAEKDPYQGNATIPGGLDPARYTNCSIKALSDRLVEASAGIPIKPAMTSSIPFAVYCIVDGAMTRVIGDATQAVTAENAFRQTEAQPTGTPAAPVVLHRITLDKTVHILVCTTENGQPDNGGLASKLFAEPAGLFARCELHFHDVASRFLVETPDDLLNVGVKCANTVMDSLYCRDSFMHGSIRWGFLGLCGWRGAYGANICGTHERMASHLTHYAKDQSKSDFAKPKPNPDTGYCTQTGDSVCFSRGRIMTGVYNMTEFWMDFMYWHYLWSGDREFLKQMYPHIRDAVAYQKRALDPDNDGLYENYANTFISDAHWYNGGGCAQSSAFTYRGNCLAAEAARLVGENPKPYLDEAAKIRNAMNSILWIPSKGFYAEYKDCLGLKRLHESPELASIYHPIDFYVTDILQSYQMLRYTEWGLENISIDLEGEQPLPAHAYQPPATFVLPQPFHGRNIWAANWFPPYPVDRVMGTGENVNTALCYFRIGQNDEGYRALKAPFLYMFIRENAGAIPLYLMDGYNCDMEHCDGVGSTMRALAEGLFGLYPDFGNNHVMVQPGFPSDWTKASCKTPDIGYSYERRDTVETIKIHTTKPTTKRLRIRARSDVLKGVTLDGKKVRHMVEPGVGCAFVVVDSPEGNEAVFTVTSASRPLPELEYQSVQAIGQPLSVTARNGTIVDVADPQGVLKERRIGRHLLRGAMVDALGFHTLFVLVKSKAVSLWAPVNIEIRQPLEIVEPRFSNTVDLVSFHVRNNTETVVPLNAMARCGGAEKAFELNLPARSVSEPVILPIADTTGISPGRNRLVIEGKAGALPCRLNVVVTTWDVFVKVPACRVKAKMDTVDIKAVLNDEMANIFNHKYLSPRSPFCSLQLAWNGFQQWCGAYGEGIKPFRLDTSFLATNTVFTTPHGIPFAVQPQGSNTAFVSRFDNFPAEISIPVNRSGRKVYFLIAGSTTPMESGIVNAQVIVHLAGGKTETLDLINPDNYDMCAEKIPLMIPYVRKDNSFSIGTDCRAQIFDMAFEKAETIERVELRCLSNDIIVGLLGITILE